MCSWRSLLGLSIGCFPDVDGPWGIHRCGEEHSFLCETSQTGKFTLLPRVRHNGTYGHAQMATMICWNSSYSLKTFHSERFVTIKGIFLRTDKQGMFMSIYENFMAIGVSYGYS